jgi:hypothetical protein
MLTWLKAKTKSKDLWSSEDAMQWRLIRTGNRISASYPDQSSYRVAKDSKIISMSKIFISHASEDKEDIALPLAELLRQRGLSVWLDQWELTIGDSLRRSIEEALSQASFGVVIVSPAYLRKLWPSRELDGLFSLETPGRKLILPVLHNIRQDELTKQLPMLSDRLSCSTDRG